MIKAYLKQVCDLEEDVYERNLKLNKANEEYEKAQKRIDGEKQRLKKELDDRRNKVSELAMKIKKASEYVPKDLFYIILGFIIALLVTVFLGWGIKALVLNVFCATDAASATVAYMVINLLPILVAFIIESVIEMTWKKAYIFIGIYIFVMLLTFGYFQIFEDKGYSISYAMSFFMVIVLVIEIIAGIITYLIKKKERDKESLNNSRWLQKNQREIKNLRLDAENAEQKLSSYISDSKKSLELMCRDIESQRHDLAKAKVNLKNLYAKNILHTKYQNWVAAATIYEYFDTGICRELQGHTGAYRFYEEQLIGKQILSSLSELRSSVIGQGYRIVNSQNYIRNQLAECIRRTNGYSFNTYDY